MNKEYIVLASAIYQQSIQVTAVEPKIANSSAEAAIVGVSTDTCLHYELG